MYTATTETLFCHLAISMCKIFSFLFVYSTAHPAPTCRQFCSLLITKQPCVNPSRFFSSLLALGNNIFLAERFHAQQFPQPAQHHLQDCLDEGARRRRFGCSCCLGDLHPVRDLNCGRGVYLQQATTKRGVAAQRGRVLTIASQSKQHPPSDQDHR
jgi:hypothetical protein